jgi:hypothetical protein
MRYIRNLTVGAAVVAMTAAGVITAQNVHAAEQPAGNAAPAAAEADGAYSVVVGQNAVEVTGAAERKAAFDDVEAGPPKDGYKVLQVTLPAKVNRQLKTNGAHTMVLPDSVENPQVEVTNNEVSLTWDDSPEGDGDAAPGAVESLQAGGCINNYYKDGKWCKSHLRDWWYSNDTAWFKGTNQYMYWYRDGNSEYNYWAIKRKGICKSKGVWFMAYCGLGSKKRTDISQKILDVAPSQDTKDNCRSISLSVGVGVASIGGDYQHCEESDINFPNRTHFSNYWRGYVDREERAVAYQYIVQTKQGERPRFKLWTPYCAGGLALC